MTKTRWMTRLAAGVAVLAAACWMVTGTFRLAAAPQVVNDAAGVTVDLGGAGLLHRAPVNYPEPARRKGVQGTVMVEAMLDGSGNVSDARVLNGPDELRKTALQSVLQWHFESSAAGVRRTVSISFQLPQTAGQSPAQETAPPVNAAPQAHRTLKSVQVLGLSDQLRDELLARLPIHQGGDFTNESRAKVRAAVREFDEHLIVAERLTADDASLTIKAPNYIPVESVAINTNGPVLLRQVAPVYPAEAKTARISGIVKFDAVIAADGTVQKMTVVSGHPLLVPAAIDAVRQWQYRPVLLNGNPVDVKTEISINFTLSE